MLNVVVYVAEMCQSSLNSRCTVCILDTVVGTNTDVVVVMSTIVGTSIVVDKSTVVVVGI